ncbi:MAG: pyridoxamine 5'-phosphate oxidase [Granulosicoccus sp.]
MDIQSLRKEYTRSGLSRNSLDPDPFKQFDTWFKQALDASIPEPNAMTLATVAANDTPSIRTVLLKVYDQNGLVFFTNYQSKKARDIAQNPNVALHFSWLEFERQLRVTGKAVKVPVAESIKYFASRPKGSQLGAWISEQSSVISSRNLLEIQFAKIKEKFAAGVVPIPDFWGGYRVVPDSFEFWQGRASRLHDRLEYRLQEDGRWLLQRLAP